MDFAGFSKTAILIVGILASSSFVVSLYALAMYRHRFMKLPELAAPTVYTMNRFSDNG
jgi:hypothetical protein